MKLTFVAIVPAPDTPQVELYFDVRLAETGASIGRIIWSETDHEYGFHSNGSPLTAAMIQGITSKLTELGIVQ